jgi:O-antigen/teichoic acid export membrane protein
VISLAINFGVQVLIVRYLSKADYGAFAYAFSLALFAQTLVTLGLDRAVTRFIPIYDEQGAYDKLFGTLLFVGGVVAGLGLLTIAVVAIATGPLGVPLVHGQARTLLLILIVLAPLEAANDLFVGLFAVFSRPRAIFFRRYVLTSGLRLLAALILVLTSSDVVVLAVGYVLTGAAGVLISLAIFRDILRCDGLLAKFRRTRPVIPAREILSFTVPLLTTDLVYAIMVASDVVLLAHFRGAEDVASLRAIQPVAQMNQLVFSSFLFLFTPAVSRLFARGDRPGIDRLYWQTAGWIAMLSAPIFLLTFSLARPLTGVLFGPRYAGSAVLLAVLSLGYFVQAALGFNGTTLMVVGRVRALVMLNLVAVTVNVGANLVAIPRLGALGAAIATTSTLIVHNVLKQGALQRFAGVRFFRVQYARLYATVAVAALVVLAVQSVLQQTLLSFAIGGVAAAAVMTRNRHVLALGETFPELLRVPFLRRVLATQ